MLLASLLRANGSHSLPATESTIGGMNRREFAKFCAGVAATSGPTTWAASTPAKMAMLRRFSGAAMAALYLSEGVRPKA